MGKENKCLQGHSLTESIFIPHEYLASLRKSRDLTTEAAVKAESDRSENNRREKAGGCLGCSRVMIFCFLKSSQVQNSTVGC